MQNRIKHETMKSIPLWKRGILFPFPIEENPTRAATTSITCLWKTYCQSRRAHPTRTSKNRCGWPSYKGHTSYITSTLTTFLCEVLLNIKTLNKPCKINHVQRNPLQQSEIFWSPLRWYGLKRQKNDRKNVKQTANHLKMAAKVSCWRAFQASLRFEIALIAGLSHWHCTSLFTRSQLIRFTRFFLSRP